MANQRWAELEVIAARFLALLACLTFAVDALAEAEFAPVVPGYRIEFPRDEGSHPAFRTEWWYVTGWVTDEAGKERGFQVTFFRSRSPSAAAQENPSKFAPRQLLFAHAALSDPQVGHLLHEQRAARAGFGLSEAREGDLEVHIDDWGLRRQGENYSAAVAGEAFGLRLRLHPQRAPLLQGESGFSRKGDDPKFASYYYSLPQLEVSGELRIGTRNLRVRGRAWLDHEWSSSLLAPEAVGWDWTGIDFDDGSALMAFRIRGAGGESRWSTSKWCVAKRGPASTEVCSDAPVQWKAQRNWRSPRTGVTYPVEWTLQIGARTLRLQPLMDDQESDSRASTGTIYWEGAVTATGEAGQRLGRGYLELTGYGSRLNIAAP